MDNQSMTKYIIALVIVTGLIVGIIIASPKVLKSDGSSSDGGSSSNTNTILGPKTDSIKEILAAPTDFNNIEVAVKGDIINILQIPAVADAAYQIDDGGGSIWVITSSGAPATNKKALVKGKVNLGVVWCEKTLGTVIVESEREYIR